MTGSCNNAGAELEKMRERIDALERELSEARDKLEQRAERTAELAKAVAALEQEAAEHKRAAGALAERNQRLQLEALEFDRALRRAETAASEKASLLVNMSHEIRTPMTAILGFAELLQEAQLRCRAASEHDDAEAEQESRRHVDMIRTCGVQLLNLINDILDITKIERARMTLQQSTVSLPEIIAEVCAVMSPVAAEKGVVLEARYRTAVPEQLHSDKTALTRILMNLVSNALKFTDKGSVTVESAFIKPQGREARVEINVIDTGIGIARENIPSLFEPFAQIAATASRPGSGLGLAISKELIRLLGGEIEVQSEPGRGSSFSFWLPCSSADGLRLVEAAGGKLNCRQAETLQPLTGTELPYRILVAEDVETNRVLIERVLRKAGAAVTLAKNGGAAVAAAMQADTPYDVILMDMVMPVLDGYQAVALLRDRGYAGPILALTASALGGDRARCLEVGCDGYLTKPINRSEFLADIRRHVERGRARQEERRAV